MKTKTIWLAPLCWALFWASCTDQSIDKKGPVMSQRELDVRFGLSALASSLAVGLVIRELIAQAAKS